MAAVPPYDIICGPDFNGQNVACSPPGDFFNMYLIGFINVFVNDVLQKLTRMLNYQQYYEKILKLKQQMFKICLYGPYYTMFATYMQQRMPTVDIDGQKIPIFDLDYIQDPPRLTVTAADGTVIDCKILHLFIGGLAINMMSILGWLPDLTLEHLPIYVSILPDDRQIGEDINSAFIDEMRKQKSKINSIRLLYAVFSSDFFSIGGGGSVSQEFSRVASGFTRTYVAVTTITTPPVPTFYQSAPNFPKNRIIWNTRNQVTSTVVYVSCFDEYNADIEFILKDGVKGGTLRICDPANPEINFQEWHINDDDRIGGVLDKYVQYKVQYMGGRWQAQNDQICQLIIMKPGQIVPTPYDDLKRQIIEATRQIGGVKRQNKSKRIRQKRSNKKSRHHNVKRSYNRRSSRFY